MFAYDHEAHCIRTYAFDRIRQAEVYLLADFVENPGFQPQQFFEAVIGVSVPTGRQPELVLLKASPERARYIETKPLHPSQRVDERAADGSVVFAYHLVHNVELENQLLSFGETVEVLFPLSLRKAITLRVQALCRLYAAIWADKTK